jgi:hypothetical protein
MFSASINIDRNGPCLPGELDDMIIDHLRTDRTTLLSLGLVNRAWLSSSRFHLLEHLEVRNKQHGDTFLALLAHPGCTLYGVRSLSLPRFARARIARRWYRWMFKARDTNTTTRVTFPCLERLSMHVLSWDSLTCAQRKTFGKMFAGVKNVAVHDWWTRFTGEMLDFITTPPVLERLHIASESPNPRVGVPPLLASQAPSPSLWRSSLHTLSVGGDVLENVLQVIVPILPGLRSLDVRMNETWQPSPEILRMISEVIGDGLAHLTVHTYSPKSVIGLQGMYAPSLLPRLHEPKRSTHNNNSHLFLIPDIAAHFSAETKPNLHKLTLIKSDSSSSSFTYYQFYRWVRAMMTRLPHSTRHLELGFIVANERDVSLALAGLKPELRFQLASRATHTDYHFQKLTISLACAEQGLVNRLKSQQLNARLDWLKQPFELEVNVIEHVACV